MPHDTRDATPSCWGSGSPGSRSRAISRAHGARVRVADTRAAPPNAAALAARAAAACALETGPFTASTFAGADLIAISPGVAKDQPAIADAVARGRRARRRHRALRARAAARAEGARDHRHQRQDDGRPRSPATLARAAGLATVVAGNIGDAVLDVLADYEDGAPWPDVFVLELSSFQLETTSSLEPTAATVLNVTANHLDRYAGIADYAAAKARIFAERGGAGAEPRRSRSCG